MPDLNDPRVWQILQEAAKDYRPSRAEIQDHFLGTVRALRDHFDAILTRQDRYLEMDVATAVGTCKRAETVFRELEILLNRR